MVLKKEIKTLAHKVETILREFPPTRNSDIELTKTIWIQFYPQHIFGRDGRAYIQLCDLWELPREDAIARCRRIVQNDEKKYPPTDWKIAEARGWLSDDWKKALGYHVESPGQNKFSF